MVQYHVALDQTLALGDGTRRGILERQPGPASISELAAQPDVAVAGGEHVRVLEEARLVTTEKKGRTREPPGMEGRTTSRHGSTRTAPSGSGGWIAWRRSSSGRRGR